MKNEHHFFECWDVWCLTNQGSFERRVVVRTHTGTWWGGLLDLSWVVPDFVMDASEWSLWNECRLLFKLKQWSALIIFYSCPCIIIFNLCEYKVYVILKWMLTFKEKCCKFNNKVLLMALLLGLVVLWRVLFITFGKYTFLPPTGMKWALLWNAVTLNAVRLGSEHPCD